MTELLSNGALHDFTSVYLPLACSQDMLHLTVMILYDAGNTGESETTEALARDFAASGFYTVSVKCPICLEDCISAVRHIHELSGSHFAATQVVALGLRGGTRTAAALMSEGVVNAVIAGDLQEFNEVFTEILKRFGNAISGESKDKDFPEQFYDNILDDRAGMFRHVPFILEQRLVEHVIQGRKAEALATLCEINSRGKKATLAKNPLRSAKNSLICSCTFLTRAVIQAGASDEEAFALSDAVIQHIESLESTASVTRYEADMLLQFIKLEQRSKGNGYTHTIRKALHYIDSNLDKQLRLKDIASYAGVHPNYLSRRFTLETGGMLSHYIITRKIHEAAYFVRHAEYSVVEIASLYGFSSQSHFITSFKKIMGVPPGQYRNQ